MYDLVVIGGGSGGRCVAKAAARVGARVALVEKSRPAGVPSCDLSVPTVGLVHAARLLNRISGARTFGLDVGPAQVDFPAVMSRIRGLAESSATDRSDEVLCGQGIDVFHGSASFDAYDTVLVDGKSRVEGSRFVIATGSRPAHPTIPGLAEAGFVDVSNVWSLTKVPASLVVLGSGPIAIEFAQVFSRFGSKVTVLTDQPSVLPREDIEVSGTVACMLTGEGISFKQGVSIEQVDRRGDQKTCIIKDPSTGGVAEVSAAEIFCAAGRLANVENLNLEAVGVHADPEHGIEVDDMLQTHSMRIYAIGDVLLRDQYTHVVEREAEVAFQNAVLRRRKKMDYSNLPWATFVDPEVATVGISEAKAKAQTLDYRVYRASYETLERARIAGRTEGFAKVVASPAGKILGATILGEEASLVLQQLVLAMESGLTLGDLAAASQIHPTYARVIRDLANQFQSTRMERGFVQTALRFFLGFQPRSSASSSDGGRSAGGDHTEWLAGRRRPCRRACRCGSRTWSLTRSPDVLMERDWDVKGFP